MSKKTPKESSTSGRAKVAANSDPKTDGRFDGGRAGGGDSGGRGAGGARSRGYTVLARRYRSREFDELIGQEAIAQTLRNAIAQDRVAHAYLFTGTRGVGKTSMARLFAKALNVTEDLDEHEEIAAAILRGDDMDVIEIDGASNRGIDGARDLIAAAGIAPARCRHKIYIIDEVHMLTTAAFNALLKTMEEPPSHVKFILCTTEAHAVPATIQSRCQRFDFRSIPAARIAAHLRSVLAQESVAYDEQAVMQIARLANGSMRDGLSLLDRLIAGVDPGSSLDPALLERMLGLPDQSLVLSIFAAVADGDPGRALAETDRLLQRGQTLEQAIETFVEHLRTLMIVAACGPESELIERSGEGRDAVIAQAERFDAPGLVHMIALCEATSRSVRVSGAGRALLDALVVRLSLAAHLASIPALLSGRLAEPVSASGRMLDQGAASARGGAPREPGRTTSDEKKKPLTEAPPVEKRIDEGRGGHHARRGSPSTSSPSASGVGSGSAVAEPDATAFEKADATMIWTAVRALAADAPRDDALVAELEPIVREGDALRLRAVADEETMQRALLGSGARLAALVRRATGLAMTVTIEAKAANASDQTNSASGIGGRSTSKADLAAAMANPLVRDAAELFEARVVGVRRVVREDATATDSSELDDEAHS